MTLTFPPYPPFGKSDHCAPGRILDLDVFLDPKEDVFHLDDFYQVLVEGVSDLQPTDEHCDSYILVAVIYQSHLTLKVIDIMVKALFELHLDREEVIVVLLKLMMQSVLAVEYMPHLFEVSECASGESRTNRKRRP